MKNFRCTTNTQLLKISIYAVDNNRGVDENIIENFIRLDIIIQRLNRVK